MVTLGTQPVGCYTEVRWSVYTVEPVYSGHPWDTTSWLLYRGGLLIQWNLYIVVTLETQPVGCYTEVRWSVYTVEPVYSGQPWDTTSWLLQRSGGLLIQWNLYNSAQAPLGHNQLVVTEVVCLYSGVTFLLEHSQLE